jgi:hypothetical protein
MKKMSPIKITRGFGLFESFLAKQRAKIADKLIPSTHRKGRILDIGCRVYPIALLSIEFSEKYGLDKVKRDDYEKWFQDHKTTLNNYDY